MHEERYTVCKPVYETVMKDCSYTVCKPVWEEKTVPVTQCVCKPVYEQCVKDVCCTEWKNVQETCVRECVRTVCKPVCEMRTVTRCVRDCHYETCCVPGHRSLKLVREPGCCNVDPCSGCTTHSFSSWKLAWCEGPPRTKCRKVYTTRQVCEQVPCTRYVKECVVEKVPYTVCKRVAVNTVKKVPYTICKMVQTQETKMVTCRTCKMVQEVVHKQVPVCTCKYVKEECVRQVPCTVCEKVPYCVTEKVCRRVPVKVAVCDSGFSLSDLNPLNLFHKSCGCNSCGCH
jgi:hypothetical protein